MRCNRGYNLINYKGVTTLGREGGLNHNGTTSHRTTNMQHKPQLQIIMAMQLRYLDGGLIFFSTIIILSMNSEFLQMSIVYGKYKGFFTNLQKTDSLQQQVTKSEASYISLFLPLVNCWFTVDPLIICILL